MIARRIDTCPPNERAKRKAPTLDETAAKLGYSRQGIRNIEAAALAKIRACLQSNHAPGTVERLAEQMAIELVAQWYVEVQRGEGCATEILVRLVKSAILGERSRT